MSQSIAQITNASSSGSYLYISNTIGAGNDCPVIFLNPNKTVNSSSNLYGMTLFTINDLTGIIKATGLQLTSALAPTYGGTGLNSYTTGDIIYCSSTNTLSKLSGNTSATTYLLTQTGTGSVSAAPVWTNPSGITVGTATNATNAANVYVSNTIGVGNDCPIIFLGPNSSLNTNALIYGMTSMTINDLTGTMKITGLQLTTALSAIYGGTGLNSYTAGDTIYCSSSNTLSKLSGNTSATMSVLTQTGNGTTSAAPIWTSTTGTGNIVRASSPTLTTPTLGVASVTSVNKVTVTAPATGSTLTIQDGLTLTVSGNTTVNQDLTTSSSPTFSAVTATTFTGALSGNATTATTATNATNVAITNNTSSSGAYIAFMTASSGNSGVQVDNLNLSYAPSTGLFRLGNSNNATAVNNFTTSIACNNSYGSGSTGVVNRFYAGGYNGGEVGLVSNGSASAYNGIIANSVGIYCQDKDFSICGNGGSGSSFTANFKFGNATPDFTALTGNIIINTAGKELKIKEGSNASLGASTLVGGTVTVTNTLVTANSRIMLTPQNSSGTAGAVYISARVASTSFTITSTQALDTRLIAWQIIEPA